MTASIDHIVIVGRDAEGWIAALALHRALSARGVGITLLELPTQLLATDVIATVPSVAGLHRMLGLEPAQVAAACRGVPMIGQRFSNWSRAAPPFIHAYEGDEAAQSDPPFHHYWVKGRKLGLDVPFEDFALTAAAAKQGRVPTPEAAGGRCGVPGYQFDARHYAGLWKKLALASGVQHREGRLSHIDRNDDGAIAAVHWEGGERFSAGLFIDASGAEAILASKMPGAAVESYAEWLPADRLLSASAPVLTVLPPFAQVSAFRAGWVGLHPLQDRTAVTGAFSNRFADKDLIEGLSAVAGAPIDTDVTVTEFAPGGRPKPWTGNCVAVGRTALELEPLDAVQIHFLHLGIARLIEQLRSGIDPYQRVDVYNGTVSGHAASLRDFQAAHYRLNRRFDEPMWDRAREGSGPPALVGKTEEFARSGTLPMRANESFSAASWTAMFIGHGLMPRAYDSWVDQMDEEQQKEMMQRRLGEIAGAVQSMPSVETYLGGALRAARPVEA